MAVGLGGRGRLGAPVRLRRRAVASVSALTGVVAIIAVGNVASGVSVQYRFPGAFVYGSDARTVSQETRGAVDWMETTAGTGNRTIADRDTGLAFGTLGDAVDRESVGGVAAVGVLSCDVKQPSAGMLEGLRRGAPRYLIVDTRMAEQVPRTGVYFAPEEPRARAYTKPVPLEALAKYRAHAVGHPDLRVRPLPHLPARPEACSTPARTCPAGPSAARTAEARHEQPRHGADTRVSAIAGGAALPLLAGAAVMTAGLALDGPLRAAIELPLALLLPGASILAAARGSRPARPASDVGLARRPLVRRVDR